MAYNDFDLSGKVTLVTGGNSGIGLGMAEGLARAGADVVIWGRNAEKNAAAKEALDKYDVRVVVRQIDVAQENEIVDATCNIVSEFGRLDFVAANAGIGTDLRPFTTLETDDWQKVIRVNQDSVFWTFREACKHMVERANAGDPGGSLLVTSSIAAIQSPPKGQAYAASKAAVISLARSIATEYGRYGIRANAVLPGFVRSDLSTHLQEMDEFNAKIIHGRVPVRRWGEPQEFAGLAVYLASDMSKFHTGDRFVVDGGFINT